MCFGPVTPHPIPLLGETSLFGNNFVSLGWRNNPNKTPSFSLKRFLQQRPHRKHLKTILDTLLIQPYIEKFRKQLLKELRLVT